MTSHTPTRDQSLTVSEYGTSTPQAQSTHSSRTSVRDITREPAPSNLAANSNSGRRYRPRPSPPPRDNFQILVRLPDGCTFPVDEDFLPFYPGVLDPAGGFVCTCQDDAKAYIAAYLVSWPSFAVGFLRRPRRAAQDDAMKRLVEWDLVRTRLDAGLEPGVVQAVQEALEMIKHGLT